MREKRKKLRVMWGVRRKKEKRPRKRGKGLKKGSIHDFERQSVCDCDKRGDKGRVVYHREDMEGLRYVGGEEQRKKWTEVYCGLGPVVAKEYDGLVGSGDDGDEDGLNSSRKRCLLLILLAMSMITLIAKCKT